MPAYIANNPDAVDEAVNFSGTFSPWVDDGKTLIDTIVFICSPDVAAYYVSDDFMALLGMRSYSALELPQDRCRKTLVLTEDVDAHRMAELVDREALFVADLRREPEDVGVKPLYPRDEMRWASVKSGYDMMMWSRLPNAAQLDALAGLKLVPNVRATYVSFVEALTDCWVLRFSNLDKYLNIDALASLYFSDMNNIAAFVQIFKELSFGLISESYDEILTMLKAEENHGATHLKYIGCDHPDFEEALLKRDMMVLNEKISTVSYCWRQVLCILRLDYEIRSIIEEIDKPTVFNETIQFLKRIGYAGGVDILIRSIINEHVPMEHVIDFNEVFRG